jgi:uncharacterized protein YcnI
LRATSGCSALAVLALAAPAAAHVTLVPVFVEANVTTRIELDVPNERPDAMTGLTLTVPGNIEIVSSEAPPGWRASAGDRRASWSGGRLGSEQTLRFPVTVLARGPAGTRRVAASQTYGDGATVRWAQTLTVLPAAGEAAPESYLWRAVIATVFGLVVVAASLVLVRRLRRRPPARR